MVTQQDGHGTAVATVTFSPGPRNNWHPHEIGQFLFVTAGKGYYQEYGKSAQLFGPSDVVNIPAHINHWHGIIRDSWFSHITITLGETEWYEPLEYEYYDKLEIG